jgi:hypothetical protein
MQPAPIRQALLRHTGALKEKRDKYRGYLERGVVGAADCCVVAVSSGGLYPQVEGVGLPRIVSALLPFGDEVVTIDRASGEVLDVSHEYRPEIRNARESPIATTAFQDPDAYGQIGAVLRDTAHISTWRGDLQPKRWLTVHNPTAAVQLAPDFFPWGRRISVRSEGDTQHLDDSDPS